MKKISKNILTVVLLVTILFSYFQIEASTVKPSLITKNLTMTVLESYDINVNNKITNSVYKRKTGNFIFFNFSVVAHALGGLEGKYTYSNSLEGLKQSLENGYKFIEVDLVLTKDNKLVCSHGWSEQTYNDTGVAMNKKNPVMTYEQFMKTKIQGRYTTIDAAKIAEIMRENKNLLFELDLRTLDKETATNTAKAIVKEFGTDKSITDRLLIQVGSEEMYEVINEVYNFKYYQYFVHKAELKDIDKVIKVCKSKGIVSVAIKEDYLTEKLLTKFKEYGLCVLIHTVDDVETAKKWLDKGVDTVCTNFITPNDVK